MLILSYFIHREMAGKRCCMVTFFIIVYLLSFCQSAFAVDMLVVKCEHYLTGGMCTRLMNPESKSKRSAQ